MVMKIEVFKYFKFYFFVIFMFSFAIVSAQGDIEIGIDEKLGNTIPMETEFITSKGDTVSLDEIVKKPFLLALVYYECPDICSPLLTELAWVADKVELVPNEDFQVVSLSFDHRENAAVAKKWKKNYFTGIKGNFPEDAWTFLTGDSANIRKITDATGFKFKPREDLYLHPGALIAISPKGKITRYIFGNTYNPFDIKMALIDAGSGKTSPTVAKVLQYCFSYDPEGRGYTLNITRIIGTIMLLSAGIFLLVLVIKKRKN